MMYQGWLSRLIDKHPGVVGVAIITGLILMLIASVIRALKRWEIIPDPLLPERWRRRINFLQRKGLEASADPKTYGVIAGSMRGGSSSSGTTGGEGDRK